MRNLEKHKNDLKLLIEEGDRLFLAVQHQFDLEFKKQTEKILKEKYDVFAKELPSFITNYQVWYSEALAIIRVLLPDRLGDFVKLYEKPKSRKDLTCATYAIEVKIE
ncbi:MAG: hypothetical protein IT395_06100 [Candidatus Omnitrophica bacterium]|nr:hypothetical protein [Candidatus Omnitrophota bacterium]